jgi:hypothetical protein
MTIDVNELLEQIENLTERVKELEKYQGKYGDAVIEIHRLRALLQAYRLDPDKCEYFPNGKQCVLKARHEGVCRGEGD